MSAIYSHDRYFHRVCWDGRTFYFNHSQACFVQVLWEAWGEGEHVLSTEDVRRRAGVDQPMPRVFRRHPAIGSMIKYLRSPRGHVTLNVKPGNLMDR